MKKIFLAFILTAQFLPASPTLAASYVNLNVPFTSEAPNGNWVNPWFNGCEEASVVMIHEYYIGHSTITPKAAIQQMQLLFDWEDAAFGSNTDASATQTARLINEYSSFNATVVENPTLNQIKNELASGRPVIAPLNGFALYHKLYGNGYHMLVLGGYDDGTKQFITNDDGKSAGKNFRYSYATVMSALSSFDHDTKKIDGKPVAIFTSAKKIVRARGSAKVYLINQNTKQYITNVDVFKNHNWSLNLVKIIATSTLEAYSNGANITK